MQTNFIWSIVFSFGAIAAYFFYWQHLKRKNQSLLEISKQPHWIEPLMEIPKDSLLAENIVDEIISPILPRKQTKPRKTREAKVAYGYDVITLYIMALPKHPFQGYDLLQAISVNGFHYGKMGIFHQHESSVDTKSPVLFSLANAMEPGFFNLSEMGSFSCNGLILFMRLDTQKNLVNDFYMMLDTATQLADDLGGKVLDDNRNSFDAASEKRYLDRLNSLSSRS